MADTLSSNLDELDLDSEDPQTRIQATIDQGTALLEEVDRYISAVITHQKDVRIPHEVNYRTLRNDLKLELAALTKLKKSNPSPENARTSNLKYYEALWEASKRSSGLVDFRRYFFWNQRKHGSHLRGKFKTNSNTKKAKGTALVDVVARGGREWIRISTSTEKRLLYDLARLGWQNDSDSDSDDNGSGIAIANNNSSWEDDEDDEDQNFLVKNARELARAARANPVRGRPPIVRIVLTRIVSGKFKEVDAVLEKMRDTGAIVECANDMPDTKPPSLESVLPDLLVDRSHTSDVLNIDCTLLMAMISDISHTECEILDWYPDEVRVQIMEEKTEKLLPTHLYPAMQSHAMVCTQAAADQMNVIVDTLATETEKVRANLLLGQKDCKDLAPHELVKEWENMSDHTVPEGFQLPIRIVQCDVDEMMASLPAVAKQIAPELGDLNAAIFFYGWVSHMTTLSANRTRARQIERLLEEVGLNDGEAAPHIYLCGSPRSLIARSGRPSRKIQ